LLTPTKKKKKKSNHASFNLTWSKDNSPSKIII